MHLLTSLLVMGVPVVGPVALLSYAEHAIQRLIFPSSTVRKLPGNLTWRTGSQVFNESALPQHLVLHGQTGAGALGFAENLTAYLGGKGYEVTDLDAALSGARTALAGSNMTAFRIAMMSFRKDLDAKIVAGAINRTVIGDFLRTIHRMDSAGPGQEPYGRGLRIPALRGR
jgi:hypothetical protein